MHYLFADYLPNIHFSILSNERWVFKVISINRVSSADNGKQKQKESRQLSRAVSMDDTL